MTKKTATIRFESLKAWEDFSKEDDETAVEKMFIDKGVTVKKPISSTHHTPPVHQVSLEAADDLEAEDLQKSKFPDGVLVHVEED
ncbi:hypothetical protein CDV55_107728 [Aspergillus turcosus]|nr:hypothetical protein CDV55_107728 [Aspergillus turcosus]